MMRQPAECDSLAMSSPLRTPVSAVLMLGGAATAIAGLISMVALGKWGLLIAVLGLVVEIGGAWQHDWMHKRRGEQQHALWGRDNRNRPSWLGGPDA